MENIQNKSCSLGNFLKANCDKTTYCQNIGSLEIDNIQEQAIDLMKKRTMYSFENLLDSL